MNQARLEITSAMIGIKDRIKMIIIKLELLGFLERVAERYTCRTNEDQGMD